MQIFFLFLTRGIMHVKETGNSSFLPSSHAALAYQRSLYDMDESIRVFSFLQKELPSILLAKWSYVI